MRNSTQNPRLGLFIELTSANVIGAVIIAPLMGPSWISPMPLRWPIVDWWDGRPWYVTIVRHRDGSLDIETNLIAPANAIAETQV